MGKTQKSCVKKEKKRPIGKIYLMKPGKRFARQTVFLDLHVENHVVLDLMQKENVPFLIKLAAVSD